jgi:selenocysteine-specific elongation factor
MKSKELGKKHVIIGTAGHIDHGKTSLVKALTGVDADTLVEEKRRGITIELGFVFMQTPDPNTEILFIDVPGHEKLVKTMVAGAANLDAALFVVAADEGVNLQTREHFDILKILDIPKGVIALTKSDLVDERQIIATKETLREFVKDSFLADALIIPVSSTTGRGVKDIEQALFKISKEIQERQDTGIFRMPIDRVFSMQGFGTVVAGTVLSGEVKVGDAVEVYPDGIVTKVRGVQVHGESSDASFIGKRTALNLLNVEKDRLRRGQCLGSPGTLAPTTRIDAKLHLLNSGKEIKNLTKLRFYTGTAETICRVAILDRDRIKPGESAPAQFMLERETVARPGDRYVIRTLSPLFTVGGGTVLDTNPGKHKRFDENALAGIEKLGGSIDDQVEQTVRKSECLSIERKSIVLALGKREPEIDASLKSLVDAGRMVPHPDGKTKRYLHKLFYDGLSAGLVGIIQKHLADNPDQLEAPLNDLRSDMLQETDQHTFKFMMEALIANRTIEQKGTSVLLLDYQVSLTAEEREVAAKVERAFIDAGFEAPVESKVCEDLAIEQKRFRKIMADLVNRGNVVRLSDKVTYHKEIVDKAKEKVVAMFDKHESVTIAKLRDEFGISRKYTQAILEYLDDREITKRIGDEHVLR